MGLMKMNEKTQVIAGHEITLTEGVRYRATRPPSDGIRLHFPITITETISDTPSLVLEGFTYQQAEAFLKEFNTGISPHAGRIW